MDTARIYLTDKAEEDRKQGRRVYVTTTKNIIISDLLNPINPAEQSAPNSVLTVVTTDSMNFFEYHEELLSIGDHLLERNWPLDRHDVFVSHPLENYPAVIAAFQIPLDLVYIPMLAKYQKERAAYEQRLAKASEPIQRELEELTRQMEDLESRRSRTLSSLGSIPSIEDALFDILKTKK